MHLMRQTLIHNSKGQIQQSFRELSATGFSTHYTTTWTLEQNPGFGSHMSMLGEETGTVPATGQAGPGTEIMWAHTTLRGWGRRSTRLWPHLFTHPRTAAWPSSTQAGQAWSHFSHRHRVCTPLAATLCVTQRVTHLIPVNHMEPASLLAAGGVMTMLAIEHDVPVDGAGHASPHAPPILTTTTAATLPRLHNDQILVAAPDPAPCAPRADPRTATVSPALGVLGHDPPSCPARGQPTRSGTYKLWLATRENQHGQPLKRSTINLRLSTLRVVLERLIEWDHPDTPTRNPIMWTDLPKMDEPLPRFLDDDQAASSWPPPSDSTRNDDSSSNCSLAPGCESPSSVSSPTTPSSP